MPELDFTILLENLFFFFFKQSCWGDSILYYIFFHYSASQESEIISESTSIEREAWISQFQHVTGTKVRWVLGPVGCGNVWEVHKVTGMCFYRM